MPLICNSSKFTVIVNKYLLIYHLLLGSVQMQKSRIVLKCYSMHMHTVIQQSTKNCAKQNSWKSKQCTEML